MAEPADDLKAENTRLTNQLKRVEAQLANLKAEREHDDKGRRRRAVSEDTEHRFSDIADRSSDEASRIARGLAYAAVESLRSTADSLAAVVDELVDRDQRRERGRSRKSREDDDQPRADNAFAALATGLEKTLDGPDRVIRRFFDTYESKQSAKRHSGAA